MGLSRPAVGKRDLGAIEAPLRAGCGRPSSKRKAADDAATPARDRATESQNTEDETKGAKRSRGGGAADDVARTDRSVNRTPPPPPPRPLSSSTFFLGVFKPVSRRSAPPISIPAQRYKG